MTKPTNEDVTYSAALKKMSTAEPAGGVTSAPTRHTGPGIGAIESASNDASRHYGGEKRRSPRYKCHGSIQLSEEGCDVSSWAEFTDVSLHGCYVEAQATYPVGTRLRMKMELNGMRLESKGAVRVNYPRLGMGIAFVDLPEENREQLRKMLGTVTYSRTIVGPGMTSVVPTRGTMDHAPKVSDPGSAVQALLDYFQTRHILTREDFLKIIARQAGKNKRETQ